MTEKRDDEEFFEGVFFGLLSFLLLDGRCWKIHHNRQTPKNNDLPHPAHAACWSTITTST